MGSDHIQWIKKWKSVYDQPGTQYRLILSEVMKKIWCFALWQHPTIHMSCYLSICWASCILTKTNSIYKCIIAIITVQQFKWCIHLSQFLPDVILCIRLSVLFSLPGKYRSWRKISHCSGKQKKKQQTLFASNIIFVVYSTTLLVRFVIDLFTPKLNSMFS